MPIIKKEQIPEEYRELWDNLIMHVDTNIDFDRVILSKENKEKYNKVITEQKNKDKLFKYRLEPVNRLLLYGASGVGKTYSLKALSNVLQYTMLYVDIARALTDDSVARNVQDIFQLGNYIAETFGGAIIFLDECDVITWNRDSNNNDTGTIRRATNSIFQAMDQMSPKAVFASATNMINRIDPAFQRRFNILMEFRRPTLEIGQCIAHFMSREFKLEDDVDETKKSIVQKRFSQNTKMSYYQIEGIINEAMKKAVLNDTTVVKTSDIYDEIIRSMGIRVGF